MIETIVKIGNKSGLHARPAAIFVQTAGKYKSSVWVEKDGRRINGKSIMGLISMAISKGSKIKLIIDGEDEEEVGLELKTLVEKRFIEEFK